MLVFNKQNQYLMLETGVGSTMENVMDHLSKMDTLLRAEKYPEAIQERNNLHLNFYSLLEGINYKSLTLACFVHSINGKPIKHTDDSLKEVAMQLEAMAMTVKEVGEITDELKKKLISNLLPISLANLEIQAERSIFTST